MLSLHSPLVQLQSRDSLHSLRQVLMKFTRREALLTGSAAAVSALATPNMHAEPAQTQAAPAAVSNVAECFSVSDFEAIARDRMEHMAWEYISGGAADEITLRWNREAYDRIRLMPRVLHDVSSVGTSVKVLGFDLPFPVILAPTALHKLAHADGEVATARGAEKAGTLMVLSTMSSTELEDVAKATAGPLWFQLYVQSDRGFTEHLVQRAEAAGFRALVVTVDTPTEGARNRQERVHFRFPPGIEPVNLRGVPKLKSAPTTEHSAFAGILPNKLTWKDIEWLQRLTKLPVLLKGILNPEDADIAARAGVAGILVSNHGARNLDTVPATIEALPRVTDKVAGRIPVLVDGGVRRGTDVLKALACGANAVLIGRPIFHGLSNGGADGVAAVLAILRREFEMAMALSGRARISEIDRSVLWS
jgi:4-hydroxymandelate oxidase